MTKANSWALQNRLQDIFDREGYEVNMQTAEWQSVFGGGVAWAVRTEDFRTFIVNVETNEVIEI